MTAPILLVTGTDTEVGKTVTTAAIAAALIAQGMHVAVVKPTQTGLAPGAPDDAATLGFAATFGETGRPLATLAVWTLIALFLAKKWFRWDDRG